MAWLVIVDVVAVVAAVVVGGDGGGGGVVVLGGGGYVHHSHLGWGLAVVLNRPPCLCLFKHITNMCYGYHT